MTMGTTATPYLFLNPILLFQGCRSCNVS